MPKLRTGSYFPDWLLGRRTRTGQALISVVATAYLLGVSTRRVEGLVQTLGIAKLSRRQVSDMAKHLDAEVQAFRNRPLDAGPYTYLWIDALVVKIREDGRTQNVSVMLATAVNRDGQREILGLDIDTAESCEAHPGAIAPNRAGRRRSWSGTWRGHASGCAEFCDASMVSGVGYAGASADHQPLDSQRDALTAAGCQRIFTDRLSGVRDDRPGLAELLSHVRAGDTAVVIALDRLSRSMSEALSAVWPRPASGRPAGSRGVELVGTVTVQSFHSLAYPTSGWRGSG